MEAIDFQLYCPHMEKELFMMTMNDDDDDE